ncbi:MAG: glycosyltransferase family 2 protein [Parvularculaceae bacterium]
MTAIAVIIVNFDSGARLKRTLAALERQTFRDFEALVFDNASKDGSAEGIGFSSIRLRTIRHGANIGFAAANNRAVEEIDAEWVAFLNPDAYPEPDWLEELISATRRHPDVDAFGSTQIDAGDPTRLDGAGDAYHVFGVPYRGHFGWPVAKLPPEGECFAPCAAAALYRRATFRALGGFDETFFCYGEDVDLGFRLRAAGGKAIQAAAARVAHEGSGVTGRRSDFTVFHGHRNRIWTFVKNMPPEIFWPALPFHVLINLYLLGRLGLIGSGGAYMRAVTAAMKGLPAIWRARKAEQAKRKVPAGAIFRMLTISPIRLARRQADIRP